MKIISFHKCKLKTIDAPLRPTTMQSNDNVAEELESVSIKPKIVHKDESDFEKQSRKITIVAQIEKQLTKNRALLYVL